MSQGESFIVFALDNYIGKIYFLTEQLINKTIYAAHERTIQRD